MRERDQVVEERGKRVGRSGEERRTERITLRRGEKGWGRERSRRKRSQKGKENEVEMGVLEGDVEDDEDDDDGDDDERGDGKYDDTRIGGTRAERLGCS